MAYAGPTALPLTSGWMGAPFVSTLKTLLNVTLLPLTEPFPEANAETVGSTVESTVSAAAEMPPAPAKPTPAATPLACAVALTSTSPSAFTWALSPRYARTVGEEVTVVSVPAPLATRLTEVAVTVAETLEVIPAVRLTPPPVMVTLVGVPAESVPKDGPMWASTRTGVLCRQRDSRGRGDANARRRGIRSDNVSGPGGYGELARGKSHAVT